MASISRMCEMLLCSTFVTQFKFRRKMKQEQWTTKKEPKVHSLPLLQTSKFISKAKPFIHSFDGMPRTWQTATGIRPLQSESELDEIIHSTLIIQCWTMTGFPFSIKSWWFKLRNCWAVNTLQWIKPEIRLSFRRKDIKIRKTVPQVQFFSQSDAIKSVPVIFHNVRAGSVKYLVTLQVLDTVQRHWAVGPEQSPVIPLCCLPETVSPSSAPHWHQQADRRVVSVVVACKELKIIDSGYVKSTLNWLNTIRFLSVCICLLTCTCFSICSFIVTLLRTCLTW